MKKTTSFLLYFVVLLVSTRLLAQDATAAASLNGEGFEVYFYESLKQKGIENYDLAIQALEQCARIQPQEAVVYFELGKNYLALKKFPQSYANYEKAKQLAPRNKWILVGMYEVCYQTKNYHQAIDVATTLIEFDPDYKEDLVALYMNTQQWDKALELINELNEKVGVSSRREAFKAEIMGQEKFRNIEISNLLAHIKTQPMEASHYEALIKLYTDGQEFEKAEQIKQLLQANIPNTDWKYVELFKEYIDQRNGKDAVVAMNQLLASGVIDVKIKHRVLNEFLHFVNTAPEFFNDLDRAISFFDNDATIVVAKEVGLYFQQKKQWDRAIYYYEMALKTNPNKEVDLHKLLLECDANRLQFEKVIQKSNLLIDKYPLEPYFYYYAGRGYNQLGQYAKGKDVLLQGLDYIIDNPSLEASYNQELAVSYGAMGDFSKKESAVIKAQNILKTNK